MDYRHTTIDTLTDFAEQHPNLTFGEIMFSFLRESSSGLDIPVNELKKLKEVSDKDWYAIVENAKKYEVEEEYFNEKDDGSYGR